MDRREPTMYAEKRYELENMKAKLIEIFQNDLCPDLKFKHQVFWEFGETKTLLLIFEKLVYMGRHSEAVNLVILFTEYQGYQGADLIVTHGYTDKLVEAGVQALKTLGFLEKNG